MRVGRHKLGGGDRKSRLEKCNYATAIEGRRRSSRDAKRSDEIDEVVHRHRDILWRNKPSFKKTRLGTAKQIRGAVNVDLAKMAIDALSEDAIRKRI